MWSSCLTRRVATVRCSHDTSTSNQVGDLSRANLLKHGINPQWLAPYQARRREQTFRWEMESLQRTTEWRVFKDAIRRMELKARRIHAKMQHMKWSQVLTLVRSSPTAAAALSARSSSVVAVAPAAFAEAPPHEMQRR